MRKLQSQQHKQQQQQQTHDSLQQFNKFQRHFNKISVMHSSGYKGLKPNKHICI